MVITDIRISKKNNASVYADGKYLLNLPLEVLIKSKLKIGSYISEEILSSISPNAELHKAKEKALRILSYRAHSKKELENKIKRTLGEDSANYAVEKMEKIGLVNDSEFAAAYARELANKKGFFGNRIKYELLKKGIDRNIISEVIENLNIDEESAIRNILKRKYLFKLKDDKGLTKVISALQRLGYSWEQISTVINEIDKLKNE